MRSLRRLAATVRRRLVPGGSVGERAATSGVWALLSNGLSRGLQMAKLVILANFLSQTAFGLVGVAMLLLVAFQRFSNLGIREALIHHPDDDIDDYLATAWVIRGVRGLVVAGIVFAGAPLIASVFAAPEQEGLLTAVVRVIGLVPVFRGFQNPGAIYLQKELAFHRDFVLRVGTAVVDVAVAVAAVLALGSVWALVYGTLAGAAARFVLSFLVHPARPSFGFDLGLAGELIGFGKWVTLSGIVAFLTTEGDDAFLGWYLGVGALGIYQTAYRFSNAPATEITQVVSSVVFPTYSQLQADAEALRAAYFRTVKLTTFLSFPAAVGIAVAAPAFVDAFINNEQGWNLGLLVLAMQALAAWGLSRSLGATTGPLFRAVGRPDHETKIQLAKLVVIVVLIVPLTDAYGVLGTAAAIVAASFLVAEPVATYVAVRTVDASYLRFLRLLAYPAAGSAFMAGCVLAVDSLATFPSPLLRFIAVVATGMVAYAVSLPLLAVAGYDIRTALEETAAAAVSEPSS